MTERRTKSNGWVWEVVKVIIPILSIVILWYAGVNTRLAVIETTVVGLSKNFDEFKIDMKKHVENRTIHQEHR